MLRQPDETDAPRSSGYGTVALVAPSRPRPRRALPVVVAASCLVLGVVAVAGARRRGAAPVMALSGDIVNDGPEIASGVLAVCANTNTVLGACAGMGAAPERKAPLMGGIDVVSYAQGTPALGDAAFLAAYEGSVLHFASDANRATFLADPEAYMPGGGGFCALALSGLDDDLDNCVSVSPVDPAVYEIIDGTLWLYRSVAARKIMDDYAAEMAAHAGPQGDVASPYDDAKNNWRLLTRGDVFAGQFMNDNNDDCRTIWGAPDKELDVDWR